MPNQKNFPDKLDSFQDRRPSRVSEEDKAIIRSEDAAGEPIRDNVVFGQTLKGVVEFYVYDELNNVVSQINIRPDDPSLRLIAFAPDQQVGVGQDLTPDFLQVNLVDILNRLELLPGRYSIALNIFRDEVGQESNSTETKLFISDISPSRKELRVQPIRPTQEIISEIREFAEPAVPQFVAQAIIDQTFGVALAPVNESGTITTTKFIDALKVIDVQQQTTKELSVASRLDRSGLSSDFYADFDISLNLIRDKTLDLLDMKADDLQIQDMEMQKLIEQATREVLVEMVTTGEINLKIQLIDSDGEAVTSTTTAGQV